MPQLISTEELPKILGIHWEFPPVLQTEAFFGNLNWKYFFTFFWQFLTFPKIFISEYFLDISLQVFTKYCFQCIFVFHRLVFTAFESVKLHELSSHSSYGNTERPANSYKNRLSANQILKRPVLLPYQWNGI